MTLRDEGPVTQRWNALRPFVEVAGGWALPLRGATLRITPRWSRCRERVVWIGLDGAKREVYQLQLEAPAAERHVLVTEFEVMDR